MTLYQYKLLSKSEQAQVLWANDMHLGERFEVEDRVLLYQIEGFYVEVFYHLEHNRIKRLRSFLTVDQLRPYLEQIRIEGLGI